jgi:cation diffusion facilitator CzcD-associated flavoprotein CzcO
MTARIEHANAEARSARGDASVEHVDIVVIGAGITGIYALYRMRELGFRVRVYDDGEGVGGTWYWNKYPGARCDTAVPLYCYSFSDELLQEWDWPEMYATQPVYERYLNFVVDKFDLRRDLKLKSRVGSLIWDETEHRWDVTLTDGRRSTARFVIAAVGVFSAGHVPDFAGIDDFEGLSLHTGHWPKEGIDLEGKRVAVIGTGASGVQIVQEVSKVAGKLVCFQRTPTYCLPIWNHEIDPKEMREMRAGFPELFRRMAESPTGATVLPPVTTSAFDVSQEERFARYEQTWNEWGHSPENLLWDECFELEPKGFWGEYSEWVKDKIRERVTDPVVAERLVPSDHLIGGRRIPGENGYYEAFNRPNVELVSLREDPIERITGTGIQTRDRAFDFDVIVYATGWDYGTGPLLAMDIRGRGGSSLKEKFEEALSVHLHLMSHGFPNLYFPCLHDTGGTVPNTEFMLDWIGEQLCYLTSRGATQIEPTREAEDEWMAWATEQTFDTERDPWPYLVGSNIPGKLAAPYTLIFESQLDLRKRRANLAANGYPGFRIS